MDMSGESSVPYFLYEAVLSLYPEGPQGGAVMGTPLWWGAVANGLSLSTDLEGVRLMSSGAPYAKTHHVDESHSIEVERTWVIRKTAGVDFVPQRNQRYVLELVWESQGFWYRRMYFGVTGEGVRWESSRALQFGNRQVYRAESFTQVGGPASSRDQIFTPMRCPAYGGVSATGSGGNVVGVGTTVGFFLEDSLVVAGICWGITGGRWR